MIPTNRSSKQMAQTIEGNLDATSLRIAVVVSRFNEPITVKLLQSATSKLVEHGIPADHIDSFWVAGAFEIPQVVKALALTDRYDGIIPLGCVIRGETPHFDYLCDSVTSGLTHLALDFDIPIVFGVLTTDTPDQALARTTADRDKGLEAAEALIELISALHSVEISSNG